jgi:enoyl-CoA hydratase/carnithine racemase
MAYKTLLVQRDGPAAVVTFNRPDKRNAFSTEMKEEVLAAVREADQDPAVRGVVFSGGAKFFSAGQDLNEARAAVTPSEVLAMLMSWQKLLGALEELGKPVFAAIEGSCMTGGLEFALACDIRVAAADATFSITSSRIGTVPGAGGTVRLPRLIGESKALEMLFSGDPVDAAEALRIGLVGHVVPSGQTLGKAVEMIRVYEKRGPLSLALAKRAVRRGMQMDQRSALDYETFLVSTIYGTEDRQEGIAAFLEKREPRFKGR